MKKLVAILFHVVTDFLYELFLYFKDFFFKKITIIVKKNLISK